MLLIKDQQDLHNYVEHRPLVFSKEDKKTVFNHIRKDNKIVINEAATTRNMAITGYQFYLDSMEVFGARTE